MWNAPYVVMQTSSKYKNHPDLQVFNMNNVIDFLKVMIILTVDLEYYVLMGMFLDLEFKKEKN